jgi:hypothetical protein
VCHSIHYSGASVTIESDIWYITRERRGPEAHPHLRPSEIPVAETDTVDPG